MTVKKRNGSIVPFDKQKIVKAIQSAFVSIDGFYGGNIAEDIASRVENQVEDNADIEKIQDMVENYLMNTDRQDVAKAYICYRYKRKAAREGNQEFIKALSDKINGRDIENQNANIDEMSFGGRVGAASDLMMKKFALEYCVSDMARKNHENNEIYIHKSNCA